MSLKYRPEIDGLRAIAVVSVVLYHGEFVWRGMNVLPGGFLGVDIFFVISGYLISTIILGEAEGEGFSFARFYGRRARRILPALFFMMIATLPLAWLFMVPETARKYAGSGLSALFFGSNFWFWLEDSYTADASALKPFLHTWTLSVEEQFYLFFPPILLAVWKFARKYTDGIIVMMLGISLIAANGASVWAPDANFYLLPFRGWELLAGALLAYFQLKYPARPVWTIGPIMSMLGLLLLVYSICTFNDEMRHPSFVTAVPILGTCLLIWFCKPGEIVADVLSTPVFRFVGLTSYSFYLWHFPAIAFLKIWNPEHSQLDVGLAIIASAVASIISYYLVERPLRSKSTTPAKVFYPLIALVSAALVGIFSWIYMSGGVPGRLGQAASLFEGLRSPPVRQLGAVCPADSPINVCRFDFEGTDGDIILIGDSHAGAITSAAVDFARSHNKNLERIATAGCPYVLGAYSVVNGKRTKDGCGPERWREIQKHLASKDPALILYIGNWPFYFEKEFYNNGVDAPVVRPNKVSLEMDRSFRDGKHPCPSCFP